MIKEFVEQWYKRKHELEEIFSKRHPEDYSDLVKETVKILDDLNSKKIHKISDEYREGVLVFVIAENRGYPIEYYYIKIYYGSCSGCDALEAINDCDSDLPSKSQTKDYMTLCLHIIQNLKKMDEPNEIEWDNEEEPLNGK